VIWGNHEPYGSIWSELVAEEEQQLSALRAEGLDIRVLHGAATEVAGVRIIGATLWTDLKLYPPFEYLARLMVSAYMQDYRAIRTSPKSRFERSVEGGWSQVPGIDWRNTCNYSPESLETVFRPSKNDWAMPSNLFLPTVRRFDSPLRLLF
ncbi:MAG: hypothetical protein ACPG77_10905, partial [Nannocystaceae bacterium]